MVAMTTAKVIGEIGGGAGFAANTDPNEERIQCKKRISTLPAPRLLAAARHDYVAARQAEGLPEKETRMNSLKTISENLTAWRRYREAVRELSQLSDRELDDIGIRRGDIEYVVRRSVASKASA